MNSKKCSQIGFVLGVGAALLGALTGCVVREDGPRHARVYAQPAPVYVESRGVVQDDYVYYPAYQVYYSSTRRHYTSGRPFMGIATGAAAGLG
jgi:hypothetical protein